jgi:hypothetical protein
MTPLPFRSRWRVCAIAERSGDASMRATLFRRAPGAVSHMPGRSISTGKRDVRR